jgi:hypothetical protein
VALVRFSGSAARVRVVDGYLDAKVGSVKQATDGANLLSAVTVTRIARNGRTEKRPACDRQPSF